MRVSVEGSRKVRKLDGERLLLTKPSGLRAPELGKVVRARSLSLSPALERAIDDIGVPYVEKRLLGLLRDSNAEVVSRVESLVAHAKPHAKRPLLIALSASLRNGSTEYERDRLEVFLTRLNAMSPDEAARVTTVIDRAWARNDNRRDPMGMADRRGVIYPRGSGDRVTDNDGLFQRFTASCGPSVIQMMLAEVDPKYALRLHDVGLFREGTSDAVASFQRELLEAHGGIAVGERAAQLRARFRNALGRLELTPDDQRALSLFVEGGPKKKVTVRAAQALEKMRRTFDGFPTTRELGDLRRQKIAPRDEGLGFDDFAAALAKIITPVTGIVYKQTEPAWGFARGQAWRHLDAVARTLRSGVLVPFGISEPSHWMLASDVEGKKPNRRFLISDPLGGKTAWVTERDLISGVFVRDQFNLCVARERGFIDSFYLPSR